MRRTPAWVFVAAAGIELAVLLLCVWGMEQSRLTDAEEAAPPPEADARPEALPPAAPLTALDETLIGAVGPTPFPELELPGEREPAPPPRPMFGPPPERPPQAERDTAVVPAFVVEPADGTTQILGARTGEGRLAFGFYGGGSMRFADADGGRYAGTVESGRARMREVGGSRAFTVQIGVAADQRLQATFTGGAHDAETIALEPLVGWSVA
ncbi:MAG TPA: hypothetical protein VGC72_13340 [Candidatus Elarobacter sp.]|jgi:hypothetical protein